MKTYNEIVSAKLFSYTQPDPDYKVDLSDVKELVAFSAKVSNASLSKQADLKNSDKLIDYLIKHSHWSPLEMADATVEYVTTRDIGRQIIRHPTFRFQEFSQRYAEALTSEGQDVELVLSEARLQDVKNRQNSIEIPYSDWRHDWWEDAQEKIATLVSQTYRDAIDNGLAKETARKILPEGMTTTRAFMKGSIRSWIHYLDLRQGNGTQKEHIVLATEIHKAINKVFPMKGD